MFNANRDGLDRRLDIAVSKVVTDRTRRALAPLDPVPTFSQSSPEGGRRGLHHLASLALNYLGLAAERTGCTIRQRNQRKWQQ